MSELCSNCDFASHCIQKEKMNQVGRDAKENKWSNTKLKAVTAPPIAMADVNGCPQLDEILARQTEIFAARKAQITRSSKSR